MLALFSCVDAAETQSWVASIFSKIRGSLFVNSGSITTLSRPDDWLLAALSSAATKAGVTVTPLSALGVPTVSACVNAVSRSMSSIPLKLHRRLKNGGKEVAQDHYLYSLLHDAPNPEMTSCDFRRAVQGHATLRNSGYALIVRNQLGEVAELWPIENKDIRPDRDAAGVLFYHLTTKTGTRPVPAGSILCIKGMTLNGISGLDAVGTAREAIGLAIALQDHGSRFFANATTPSMGVELPPNMTPKQVEDWAAKFRELHSGKNQHRFSVLWGGAKFGSGLGTVDNEKSQFLEAKVHQDKCICQVYGVPQIKAGITDAAHFNNVEQENQNYVTDVLMSWCAQWEQSLNQKLLTREERKTLFFEFVLDGLLRADIKTRYESHQLAIQNGIKCRNEVRAQENMNPVEGGDRFIIPANMTLLDATGVPVPANQGAKEVIAK